LALHARDDEVAGPRNLKILESRLDSQAFRALWLEDSHHMITIDNDRQLVARATVQFVDTVASGSAHAPLAEGVPTHAQDHDHDHV
jgi:carboxylesterase